MSSIPNVKSFRLLYRGSQNQFLAKRFHESCDGQGATISIVQSDQGKMFGLFTDISWQSLDSKFTTGKGNTFKFALTELGLEKFPIK